MFGQRRIKRRKLFGEGKYLVSGRENEVEKRAKHFEKESISGEEKEKKQNIGSAKEKKNN